MKEFIRVIRSWNNFSGRADRREYWMSGLFFVIFIFIACTLDSVLEMKHLFIEVLFLFYFVPSIAVSVRRLHDIDKSGYWLLINFIPFGIIWFLYLALQRGDFGRNRYGMKSDEPNWDEW